MNSFALDQGRLGVMDTTTEWWAGIGGQAVGPLSTADIRAHWQSGEITAATLVWRAGFPEWRAAGEVDELAVLRRAASTPAAWQPGAGSALAALAGAELGQLRAARPNGGQSGSAILDAASGANRAVLPRNEATGEGPRHEADAAAVPARAPDASPSTTATRKRAAVTAAAGTFAMGAAVAVALLLVFRGGERRTPAPAPAATASADVQAQEVARGVPAPAPSAASPSPAAPAETRVAVRSTDAEGARPEVARAPVASAEPVRASDPPRPAPPPAAATPVARRNPSPAKTSTDARRARKPAKVEPKVAAAEPQHAGKKAVATASDPLAMAGTPATAPPAKSPSRDPLADLVTDADLDHELGGAAAAKEPQRSGAPAAQDAQPQSSAAAAKATAQRPKPADTSVYVPPAPGGDLPEGVTPAQINEAVKARMSSLRSCIDEQRAADPASKGTLKLRWVIGGDGSVKDVRNLSSEFESKPIARCISGVVREIRFPTSRTAGQEVVFPFKF